MLSARAHVCSGRTQHLNVSLPSPPACHLPHLSPSLPSGLKCSPSTTCTPPAPRPASPSLPQSSCTANWGLQSAVSGMRVWPGALLRALCTTCSGTSLRSAAHAFGSVLYETAFFLSVSCMPRCCHGSQGRREARSCRAMEYSLQ